MQIYEAKQIVLGMSKFYKPPKPASDSGYG